MSHHHKSPFIATGLLIVITILTGVGTFTDYWGTGKNTNPNVHFGIYMWGKADANSVFRKSPGWLQCVVVCQLIAFSLELLFIILMVPSVIFRQKIHVHAANSLIALLIFILLTISVIVFAANISTYSISYTKFAFKVGWSWGLVLAADILSLFLLLLTGSAVGYGAYREYR